MASLSELMAIDQYKKQPLNNAVAGGMAGLQALMQGIMQMQDRKAAQKVWKEIFPEISRIAESQQGPAQVSTGAPPSTAANPQYLERGLTTTMPRAGVASVEQSQTPDTQALLRALTGDNPTFNQQAGNYIQGAKAIAPQSQFINQEAGGLQQAQTNPLTGAATVRQLIPSQYKPAGLTSDWTISTKSPDAARPLTKKVGSTFSHLYEKRNADGTMSYDYRSEGTEPQQMAGTSFSDMGQQTKDTWFETYQNSGKMPPFAYRDSASRNAFTQGYADYLQRKGVTPTEAITNKVEMDALGGSLKNQQKIYGMMGSFINNLTAQVRRVKEMQGDVIKRVGVRGLDLPIREFKTRFQGSGEERVLQSYLMEISREIGKLSTGSQASIAELSVEAQKKWDQIHDPNLSLRDLGMVLDATMEQAALRRSGSQQELETTKNDMRNIGKPRGMTQQTSAGTQTFNVNGRTYQIPADKVDEFKRDMGIK